MQEIGFGTSLAFRLSAVLYQRSLPATCTRLHASSPGRRITPPGRDCFIFAGFSLGWGITGIGDAMRAAKQIDCSAPLT
jgi:hypothetical protein